MLYFTAASQDFHFFPGVLCTGWVGFARYIRLMQCILEQVLFNQYYLVILFCSAWWQVWASGVVDLHRYYLVTVPHGLAKSEGRNITDSSTTALQMKRLCNLSCLMHLWVSVSQFIITVTHNLQLPANKFDDTPLKIIKISPMPSRQPSVLNPTDLGHNSCNLGGGGRFQSCVSYAGFILSVNLKETRQWALLSWQFLFLFLTCWHRSSKYCTIQSVF